MSGSDTAPTILVVDDEPEVADVYANQLEKAYDVRTAYGGREALDAIDDSVDVVLLDRRMPGRSGDEVLARIREVGYDCRVVMVTAITPDYDILALPFDDYLSKPVASDDLFDAIDKQLRAVDHQDAVSEYFTITAKQSLLEQHKSPLELEDHEEYRALTERREQLEAELGERLESSDDVATAFSDIDRR